MEKERDQQKGVNKRYTVRLERQVCVLARGEARGVAQAPLPDSKGDGQLAYQHHGWIIKSAYSVYKPRATEPLYERTLNMSCWKVD